MSSEENQTPPRPGLFSSIKKLGTTLLEIVSTRLELLVVELEEERAWLGALLIWTLLGLFCAALASVLIALFVVVYFWDTHRLEAFAAVTLVFIFGAVFSWRTVMNKIKTKPRLFSSSFAAMSKDIEQLRPDHEQGN